MSTKRLTTRLRDPKEWDVVLPDVPIFVEHEMYELAGGESIAVLPGKSPPAGATLKYKVDEARLVTIANQINEDLDKHDCPIQLRDGHTKHGAPQSEQPKVVGYGSHVKVSTWNGSKAITTPLHYEKGYGSLAQDRPQRSPEFRFRKNSIPDVALLATEPRLKMGMTHRYEAADDIVRYGMDMAIGDPTAAAPPSPSPAPADDPTDPTALTPTNVGGLTPDEQAVADKIFDYLCSSKPQLTWMCGQFKDAQASPNQEPLPAAPGDASPLAAPGLPQSGGPPESQPYSDEAVMDQKEADALRAKIAEYEKAQAALTKERDEATRKYAESEAERYLLRVQNYAHDEAATKGLLIKATSTAERDGIIKNICNFNREKKSSGDGTGAPTSGMLPVDTTNGTESYSDNDVPVTLLLQIAKEKNLDFGPGSYQQLMLAGKERLKAART